MGPDVAVAVGPFFVSDHTVFEETEVLAGPEDLGVAVDSLHRTYPGFHIEPEKVPSLDLVAFDADRAHHLVVAYVGHLSDLLDHLVAVVPAGSAVGAAVATHTDPFFVAGGFAQAVFHIDRGNGVGILDSAEFVAKPLSSLVEVFRCKNLTGCMELAPSLHPFQRHRQELTWLVPISLNLKGKKFVSIQSSPGMKRQESTQNPTYLYSFQLSIDQLWMPQRRLGHVLAP
jgi:hypothetical protein